MWACGGEVLNRRCIIRIPDAMEILPASDRALLVRLSGHEPVFALAKALEGAAISGITSYSPGYASVLVRFDPSVLDAAELEQKLANLVVRSGSTAAPHRDIVLPVRFDGPDLQAIADSKELTTDDVISIFCAEVYRVYFLGFAPGFAYMGDVDERIAAPRHPSPRKAVPAGSVGIAGRQTGIYPFETPGGWNLIGTCLVPMFATDRNPPSLLRAGDSVRFERT